MDYVMNTTPSFSAVRRQPVAKRSLDARRRHIKQVVILIGVAMAFAMLFVWIRIQVIQLGYEVSRIRGETRDLIEQKNLLEAEVASLRSHERLERVARENFDMRLPQGDEIVFVPSGGARETSGTRE